MMNNKIRTEHREKKKKEQVVTCNQAEKRAGEK